LSQKGSDLDLPPPTTAGDQQLLVRECGKATGVPQRKPFTIL
jgi:hypothetical protein